MYIDLPIIFFFFFFFFLNLFFMSVKSLIIHILFYILFYFRKYLFYCIRTTDSSDYISNPVYYRSNSSLEINRSLHVHFSTWIFNRTPEFPHKRGQDH